MVHKTDTVDSGDGDSGEADGSPLRRKIVPAAGGWRARVWRPCRPAQSRPRTGVPARASSVSSGTRKPCSPWRNPYVSRGTGALVRSHGERVRRTRGRGRCAAERARAALFVAGFPRCREAAPPGARGFPDRGVPDLPQKLRPAGGVTVTGTIPPYDVHPWNRNTYSASILCNPGSPMASEVRRAHHQVTFAVLTAGVGAYALLQSLVAPVHGPVRRNAAPVTS
jgi:hypothetical protein